MSKHTVANLNAALRDLDPMPEAALTAAERDRAEATFARIVATPVDGPVPAEPVRRRRRNRPLLAAAGLVGAAAVAVPVVLFGGGSAYASWTAKPEPLTGAAAADAGTSCHGALDAPGRAERAAVAERRGDWTFVVLAGHGTQSVCLMPDDAAGRPDAKGFFGARDDDVSAPPALAPDALVETTAMSSSTDEGWFTWATGDVGSDVTGVTVRTPGGDVEATVSGQRFAAWWPGNGESWSYVLHLSDGSTKDVS